MLAGSGIRTCPAGRGYTIQAALAMSTIASLWHGAATWLGRDVVTPVLSTLHVDATAGDHTKSPKRC
jgi:hypothetical protein